MCAESSDMDPNNCAACNYNCTLFSIFGALIGRRIGEMPGYEGLSYIEFMVPGLIMLSVITNSYANVASAFFGTKFQKSIEEILVSPMPSWAILVWFLSWRYS